MNSQPMARLGLLLAAFALLGVVGFAAAFHFYGTSFRVIEGLGPIDEFGLDARIQPMEVASYSGSRDDGLIRRAYHYDPVIATWPSTVASASDSPSDSAGGDTNRSWIAAPVDSVPTVAVRALEADVLERLALSGSHAPVLSQVIRAWTWVDDVGDAQIAPSQAWRLAFALCIGADGKRHAPCCAGEATVMVSPALQVIKITGLRAVGVVKEDDLSLEPNFAGRDDDRRFSDALQ